MAFSIHSNLKSSDDQLSGVEPVKNVLEVGEVENFLEGKPTGISSMPPESWEECFCALHVPVACGMKSGEGCRSKQPGTLPMLAVLYGKNVVRRCHAEPATRHNDWVFSQLMLDLTRKRMALFDRPEVDLMKLSQGQRTSVEDWGAGYCYQLPVLSSARLRGGRVLGPLCLALDVLRLVRCVGLSSMARLKIQMIGGHAHVVKDKDFKGVDKQAGQRFAKDLMELIKVEGDGLRIGYDHTLENIAAFKRMLEEVGIVLSDNSDDGLRIALHVAASMPADVVDGKVALRRLALVGDRAMKLVLAEKLVDRAGVTVEAISKIESTDQSDANFSRLAESAGLLSYVTAGNNVDVTSAKVGGTAFEAMVGVAYLDGGLPVVAKFMKFVGVRVE